MISWRGVLCLNQEIGASDASSLDPLTEDAFLSNLHQRYKRDQIYTYIGTMVVSINPFKKLALYSPEVIAAYQHHNMLELPPHIYAVAECAFQSMKERNHDQCIVITGEAGKIALQYLVRGVSCEEQLGLLGDQLLSTSQVLEAFGNAKTRHNDNSSRFCKFLEIEFDFKGDPVGGTVTNYLLEKSRVIRQSEGTRSFHFFYQLLAGADVQLLKFLKLQRNLDYYNNLKSGCYTIEDVDDKSNFLATKRALEILSFSPEEISCILQVVSAVLKLGNLQFLPRANIDGTEGCSLLNEYEIYDVCELLLTDLTSLETALTQRTIETRHEILVSDLSAAEAMTARDALCKALYSRLFTWLANRMNESIRVKKIERRNFIGILDIFGFEVFETNGFEQLLINFCNEKLHNICTELTLKYDQEEYVREGIQWKRIDFFNNSVICDLIERNNHGILALLDDECLRLNPVNDEMFLQILTKACQDNPYFESHGCKSFVVPHLQLSNEFSPSGNSSLPTQSFRLRHFAGTVIYSVKGFIEKNNDTFHRDLSLVMYQSENPLLKVLFPEGNPKRTQLKRPASTASQFKISIGALLKNIQTKQLSFVKCIKPNAVRQPLLFEVSLVQFQMRYQLLLETTKLRRAGFFYRQEYDGFLKRYKMLSPQTWPFWRGSSVQGVTLLLKTLQIYPPECALGRTKIFIRSLRTLFAVEDYRTERIHQLATLIQKLWRGWIRRRYFLQMRASQRIISCNYRCWKRRRYLVWLSRRLPSRSPLSRDWPPAPRSLHDTSYLLKKLYHKWRCNIYRLRFDQTARNRMREKVTASLIFRDRKASYPKSVAHPFRGDYIRLRQNGKWNKTATDLGDQYVVFADIINKITRSNGKCAQKLFVISTSSMIVMDQRTLQIKYRIPVNDIYRISLSPYMDDLAIIHVRCTEVNRRKGAFVFETGHVIEIVTKLFLVIQNATGKAPEVQISNEFEANFGKDVVTVIFRCTGPPDSTLGPARISRKTNKLEVVL